MHLTIRLHEMKDEGQVQKVVTWKSVMMRRRTHNSIYRLQKEDL